MRRAFATIAIVAGAALVPLPADAGPASTIVDTFVDESDGSCADGDCSLRDAIATSPAGGEVVLPSGFYPLSIAGPGGVESGDLDISADLLVRADGDTGAFVSAPPGERVLDVRGGSVRVEGLTLLGGNVDRPGERGGNGGVIEIDDGSLTLVASTITGGHASAGGGLHVRSGARLRLIDSLILDNAATDRGGGLSVLGTAFVRGSSFSMNHAGGRGGGLFAGDASEVSISDSTLARNRALIGGGVALEGAAEVSSVTIAFNRADERGGGFAGESRSSTRVGARSTVVGRNQAGSRPDCVGSVASLGHNLSQRSGCGFDHPSDLRGVDPRLGAFDPHGGPTPTVVLMASSPAIDLGGRCSRTDQRGAPRDDRCDAGAYERVLCLGRAVNIVGTPGDDELSGGREPDSFLGLAGDDEFQGSLDDDVACGSGGDDHLIGGPDDDRLSGGPGNDLLDGEEGRDRCWGGPGRDELIACED